MTKEFVKRGAVNLIQINVDVQNLLSSYYKDAFIVKYTDMS